MRDTGKPMAAAIRAQLDFAQGLFKAGQMQGAEAIFRAVLRQEPACVEALNGLAVIHVQAGRAAEARQCFEQVLALQPEAASAFNNYGVALEAEGRLVPARDAYREALAREPAYLDALNNLGNVLRALFCHAEAAAVFARALEAEGALPDVLANYGRVLFEMGRDQEALDCYTRALEQAPGYAEAHWNAALCHLWRGDFAQGWHEYEWRWKRPGFTSPRRNFRFPLWLGAESLQGRRILLHAEQGLGDTLQFLRYVPEVIACAAQVVLEVQKPLKVLCEQSFPACVVRSRGEPLPEVDFHCPLLSLPLAVQARLPGIPAPSVLAIDAERQAQWRERLAAAQGLKVGLGWAGNPGHWNDANRSLALQSLLALQELPGVSFVALQKDARETDREAWAHWPELFDASPWLDDLADTAALIAELDLVIAVDSSVAHLAGVLGKPTWILLSAIPEWRWQKGREDSLWYPSVRLFQQQELGEWRPVLKRLADACSQLAEKHALAGDRT